MKILIIDGKFMDSKDSLYRHLRRVFSLPNHFADNLDSLWDILTEENEESYIYFLNVNQAKKGLGNYAEKLIRLLNQLAVENSSYTIYLYE